MVYKIKDCLLEVNNEIYEFEELIHGRFSQFEIVKETEPDNYLKFTEIGVYVKIKGIEKELKGKVIKTDIYVIINNILAFIINDKNNIYIHSVSISNKNQGTLIVGSFGQGKTTLAKEFIKYGYEINSTDQTWLKVVNGNLIQMLGSKFYIENERIKYIKNESVKKKIKINKIIRIIGVCDNGITDIIEQSDNIYRVKQIADYCNWTNITPLFTSDIELYDIKGNTKYFWLQINNNLSFFNVRGDKREIVKLIR